MTTLKIQNAAYVNEANGIKRHRNAKPIMCVETGEIYASLTDAALAIGVSISYISNSIPKGWRVKGNRYIYLSQINEHIGSIGTRINVVNKNCADLEFKANKVPALEQRNQELEAEAKRLRDEKVDMMIEIFKQMPPDAMDMFIEGMRLVRESRREVV